MSPKMGLLSWMGWVELKSDVHVIFWFYFLFDSASVFVSFSFFYVFVLVFCFLFLRFSTLSSSFFPRFSSLFLVLFACSSFLCCFVDFSLSLSFVIFFWCVFATMSLFRLTKARKSSKGGPWGMAAVNPWGSCGEKRVLWWELRWTPRQYISFSYPVRFGNALICSFFLVSSPKYVLRVFPVYTL